MLYCAIAFAAIPPLLIAAIAAWHHGLAERKLRFAAQERERRTGLHSNEIEVFDELVNTERDQFFNDKMQAQKGRLPVS